MGILERLIFLHEHMEQQDKENYNNIDLSAKRDNLEDVFLRLCLGKASETDSLVQRSRLY